MVGNDIKWTIDTSGYLVPDDNNTYDIGTVALRPRFLYVHDINIDNNSAIYARNAANDDNIRMLFLDGGDNTTLESGGDVVVEALGDDAFIKASDDIYFYTVDTARWIINNSGHLVPNVDNTYDIGAADLVVNQIYTRNVVSGTNDRLYVLAEDNLYLEAGGNYTFIGADTSVIFNPGGTNQWRMNTSGTFYPYGNGVRDLGGASNHCACVFTEKVTAEDELSFGHDDTVNMILENGPDGYTQLKIGDNVSSKEDGAMVIGGEVSGSLTTSYAAVARYTLNEDEAVTGIAIFTASKDGGGLTQCHHEIIAFSRYQYGSSTYYSDSSSLYSADNSSPIEVRVGNSSTDLYFEGRNSTGVGTYQLSCAVYLNIKEL